jgi:hypothetical protein
MVDEFIDKLHTLERNIMDAFVLDADMRKYLCEMKEENAAGESDEYISMAFGIAAMYFHDAIKFVPVVLLVEVSRKINQGFGGYAESVVYWICGLPQQDIRRLTHSQLVVIREWLVLVAADDFADDDIGVALDIVDRALGNSTEHEG